MKGQINSIQSLVRGVITSLFLTGALVSGNASAQALCTTGDNQGIDPHKIVSTCPTFIFTNPGLLDLCGQCAVVECTEMVYSHGGQQYCGPFYQWAAVGGARVGGAEDETIYVIVETRPETRHHQACYDRNDGWKMPIATDRNGTCRSAGDTQADAAICETIDPDSEGGLEPGYFRDTFKGSCVPDLLCKGSAPFKQHPSIALGGPGAGGCISRTGCENTLSGFANAVTELCETIIECPGENQARLANNTCYCVDEYENIGDSTTLNCVRLCESGHERINGVCIIAIVYHQACYNQTWRMPIAADTRGNCRAAEGTEADREICSRIIAFVHPVTGQAISGYEAGYFSDTFGGACAINRNVTCPGTKPFKYHPSVSLSRPYESFIGVSIGICLPKRACVFGYLGFGNTVTGACEAPTKCRDDQERQPDNTCACPDGEEAMNDACVLSKNEDRTSPVATHEEHNKASSHLFLLPVCCWATGLAAGLMP